MLSSHGGVRSEPPAVGHPAPLFSLSSVQGDTVDLATYRGRANVVVWFSRGFTCPFCRVYMDGMTEGYEELQAAGTEIIQVGPNLLPAARVFFGHSPTPIRSSAIPTSDSMPSMGWAIAARSRPPGRRW